jgi:hypothetical protein
MLGYDDHVMVRSHTERRTPEGLVEQGLIAEQRAELLGTRVAGK